MTNIRKHAGFPLILSVGLLLAGCSSVVDSHTRKQPMMQSFTAGNNSAAMAEINERLKEPAWYNSSTVNTGDELIWRLEAGSLNFHLGNFSESIKQFTIAEELIRNFDERATVSLRDVSAEAGAALTNMNALPYRGWCRDRIAICIFKSLAYLGDGREDAFRAQIKRLRNEQKKVQDDYRDFFEQEQARLEAVRESNPQAAANAAANSSASAIAAHQQNRNFAEDMKKVQSAAHRGYGNFLNPAAIFLSGLGSLRDENYDNARIDFQRICEAMPDNAMAARYYVSALTLAKRPIPAELSSVQPFDFPLDRDCVYVLTASGRSAALKQTAVHFPFMAAWPMCEFYPSPFNAITVQSEGKTYPAGLLADMDAVLAEEFDERLNGIIARVVLSTAIKEAAYYASLALVASADMDPTAQALALTGIAVGGAIYRQAMNTADTRSWEILPKNFHLAVLPMPHNRVIDLQLEGQKTIRQNITLPADCRSAIVFVSAPAVENVISHILPIKSK